MGEEINYNFKLLYFFGIFFIVAGHCAGGGISTLYAHGSEIMVQVGETVKRGETVVLKVGSTGYSTGPHAHFEVRINGKHVNPVPYIK